MPLPPGFVDELVEALGAGSVITEPERLATYDCDVLTGWRAQPACVVLPGSVAEVQSVLRLCARDGIPFGTWTDRYVDWFRDLGFLGRPGVPTRAAADVEAFAKKPAR